MSKVPYQNPCYSFINAPGRYWIFEYTLAVAKELLGYVRGKYTTVPIPGAAPPAVGKIGKTLKVNTAPVMAVNETASVVLGAVSASVHIASNRELATPQSCSNSIVNVHCLSTDL